MRCLFSLTGTSYVKDRTVQGDLRYYLLKYQDERGKMRLAGSDDSVKLRRLTPDKYTSPQITNPVLEGLNRVMMPPDYHRGRLTAAGFLKDQLVLSGMGPERYGRHSPELLASKARWVGQVAHLWSVNLAKYRNRSKDGKKSRYNFFLSLDSQTTKELTERGFSAPVMLEQVLHRTVKRYLEVEGFDPKDRLGYVYGFHFDRAHLHIHIAFFPRSEMGKELRSHDRDHRKLDKDGKKVNHLKRLTVMACEEADALLKDMYARDRLYEMEKIERTKHIFRSSKVVKEHGPNREYGVFEASLVERYQQVNPELSVQELLEVFRSYAGMPPAQRKLASLPAKLPDMVSRRLYRLWLADQYERSEAEDALDADRKRKLMGASAPGLPASIAPYYNAFWDTLLRTKRADLSEQIARLSLRKKEAVSRDIQQGGLPVLRDALPAGYTEAQLRFVTYLDRLLLLGQTIFFSQATLRELEYAVYLRVSDVATLRALLPVASAGASSGRERDTGLEPAVEPAPTPEQGEPTQERKLA